MNSEEHSFIQQIKRAKVTDEEKAVLCCALAEGKPFKARNGIGSYLMALIHLEWRDFKEIREDERERIIDLFMSKELMHPKTGWLKPIHITDFKKTIRGLK